MNGNNKKDFNHGIPEVRQVIGLKQKVIDLLGWVEKRLKCWIKM